MPNISSKELSGLEDILGIEQNLVTKYATYAGMVQEPQLQKKMKATAKKHQAHFNTLVSYLK